MERHARPGKLTRLLGKFANERGDEFNDSVAESFCERSWLTVRKKIQSFAPMIPDYPSSLGDIDVVVGNPRRKSILVVETKRLAIARNFHEMSQEVEKLFSGPKCAVERLKKRTAWVSDHRVGVVKFLGLESTERWDVECVVVTDADMLATMLLKPSVATFSLRQLKEEFLPSWAP
jgi:hypothetical protein